MSNGKIIGLWTGIFGILVGAPVTYFVLQGNEELIQTKDVKKMSEKDQEAFMVKISDMVINGEKPSVIEEQLEKQIAGLSKERASEAFYTFLYSLSFEQGSQTEKYQVLSEELISAYNNNQFEAKRNASFDKVKDESVKGYLTELNRQFLYLEDDGEGLVMLQDLERLEKKYKPFFDEGLTGLMEVKRMTQEKPYASSSYTSFNLKENLEYILRIEGKRTTWQDTIYHDEMMGLQESAYMDFFGVTHDAYFNEKDGALTLKEEVKDEMWALMKEYSNSFMGDEILAFMDELESNDWLKPAEQESLYKRMYERFAVPSAVQAPLVQVSAPDGTPEEAKVEVTP